MPIARSAGAVVFRLNPKGQPLYLLLHHTLGHWDFPKGTIEKGEKTEETIRREVGEESGITSVDFVPGFKETMHYFFQWEGKKVSKWVVYLLAQTKEEKVKLSFEHDDFAWLPFEEAYQRITFANSKEVLRKAHRFFQEL